MVAWPAPAGEPRDGEHRVDAHAILQAESADLALLGRREQRCPRVDDCCPLLVVLRSPTLSSPVSRRITAAAFEWHAQCVFIAARLWLNGLFWMFRPGNVYERVRLEATPPTVLDLFQL